MSWVRTVLLIVVLVAGWVVAKGGVHGSASAVTPAAAAQSIR